MSLLFLASPRQLMQVGIAEGILLLETHQRNWPVQLFWILLLVFRGSIFTYPEIVHCMCIWMLGLFAGSFNLVSRLKSNLKRNRPYTWIFVICRSHTLGIVWWFFRRALINPLKC